MMNKKRNNRTSANELYNIYSEPQILHNYKNGYKFTEGIYDIVNNENCIWLFELILDQKHSFDFKIEIWNLSRIENEMFMLKGKNKLGFEFIVLDNLESDFYFDELTIIKKGNLFCLPVEDIIY